MLNLLEIIINTTSHTRDFNIPVMHVTLIFKGQGQAYSHMIKHMIKQTSRLANVTFDRSYNTATAFQRYGRTHCLITFLRRVICTINAASSKRIPFEYRIGVFPFRLLPFRLLPFPPTPISPTPVSPTLKC